MRRALVIAGVMLAGLLACAPAQATAASSPHPREEALPEEEFEFIEPEEVTFSLSVEGFTADVLVEDNGVEQTATLVISRDGLTSTYQVPAIITDDSVSAKFGGLGGLDFDYGPRKGARKCLGKLTFTGSFDFVGEGGYVHIDATEVQGAKEGGEFFPCTDFEGEEGFLEVGEPVDLEAAAGSVERAAGRQVIAEDRRPEGRGRWIEISASQVEEKEGMRITRGAEVRARPESFRHDVKAGTATVKPPAPFTGWAHLTPGRGRKGIWEGTLRLPTLSGRPIELTGPAFRGHFAEERRVADS